MPAEGGLPRQMRGLQDRRGGKYHRDRRRVRPGQPGGRPRRRPEGEGGDHPLGGRGHRRGCGGAAVRQPVQRPGPGRRREGFPGLPEPRLSGGAHRLQAGGQSRLRPAGRPVPVPSPGLLLRRQ